MCTDTTSSEGWRYDGCCKQLEPCLMVNMTDSITRELIIIIQGQYFVNRCVFRERVNAALESEWRVWCGREFVMITLSKREDVRKPSFTISVREGRKGREGSRTSVSYHLLVLWGEGAGRAMGWKFGPVDNLWVLSGRPLSQIGWEEEKEDFDLPRSSAGVCQL